MLKKLIANFLFLISLSVLGAAQTADADKQARQEKLQADAVAFLRETSSEIMNLQTPENRIGFNSELANLMWFHDEREARVMFNSVTNDFRQMLVALDAQINSVKFDGENTELYSMPFIRSPNRQAQVYRKFSKAMSVRQQIASALSEHDALLAYAFYNETAAAITNPKFREQIDQRDTYFEAKLLQSVAEQDAAKGLEFGRKSLAKGVNNNHIELLKKIYAKDADIGASYGEEILRKLKSGDDDSDNVFLFSSILSLGLENRKAIKDNPAQRPIFSDQDLRDAAELAARRLLAQPPQTIIAYSGVVDSIEQFSPARAAQLRQKMKTAAVGDANSNSARVIDSAAPPPPPAPQPKPDGETLEELKNLDASKLTDEQRAAAIAEASKTIERIEDPVAKLTALTAFAAQMAKSGDKELALQFMKQAESFANPSPKNYIDYLQMWMLVSGYAEIDAEKSFPILESAVYNLNDTISAFIKVAEFIDVSGEIVEDGEVQVGSFGGGLTRELIGGLGTSEPVLRSLAEADFTRMRNVSNKFDRTEIRILAKMLILRAVFADKKASLEKASTAADDS